MKTQGVRILDKIERVVSVELPDILAEIPNGDSFYWSILYVDGMTLPGKGLPIVELAHQVDHSENGLIVNWKELNFISTTFYQTYDIVIIGCRNKKLIIKYDTNREACAVCDIFVEMFDSSYWEVFAKDEDLIQRLALKFKEIEMLEADEIIR